MYELTGIFFWLATCLGIYRINEIYQEIVKPGHGIFVACLLIFYLFAYLLHARLSSNYIFSRQEKDRPAMLLVLAVQGLLALLVIYEISDFISLILLVIVSPQLFWWDLKKSVPTILLLMAGAGLYVDSHWYSAESGFVITLTATLSLNHSHP